VERLARLAGRVNVSSHLCLHEALLVVDRCLYHAVADRLGYNVLGRLFALQTEADANVTERDTRVGQRQHTDASLDDILSQAEDQGVSAVLLESRRVRLHNLQESLQITDSDSSDEAEVWLEGALEAGLAEDVALGNVAHEQLDHNQQLHRGLVEACGDVCGGGFAGSANQVLVCFRVRQLNGAYATEVEEIPRNLVVGGIRRELRLRDEEIGLCDVGGGDVVAEQERGDRRLRIWVFPEHGTSQRREQLSADVDDGRLLRRGLGIHFLVEEREVEVGLGGERVQRPPVELSDLVHQLLRELGALLVVLLIVQIDLESLIVIRRYIRVIAVLTYLDQDSYVHIHLGRRLLGAVLVNLHLLLVLRHDALYRLAVHAEELDEGPRRGVVGRVCEDDDGA
jgi:hypothetical protein